MLLLHLQLLVPLVLLLLIVIIIIILLTHFPLFWLGAKDVDVSSMWHIFPAVTKSWTSFPVSDVLFSESTKHTNFTRVGDKNTEEEMPQIFWTSSLNQWLSWTNTQLKNQELAWLRDDLLSSLCLTLLRRPVNTRLITEEKDCAVCLRA